MDPYWVKVGWLEKTKSHELTTLNEWIIVGAWGQGGLGIFFRGTPKNPNPFHFRGS